MATAPSVRSIPPGFGRVHPGLAFARDAEAGSPARLERGVFTFSLDLELSVSTLDSFSRYARQHEHIAGARRAVRGLLELLDRYQVSATWAVVAQLFRPSGPLQLSVDEWVAHNIPHDSLYAPDIVDDLLACATAQDIGCHSYRHVNMASPDIDGTVIDEELQACQQLAATRGIDMRSFVFPYNRIAHLDKLAARGYTSFRGANSEWYMRRFSGQNPLYGVVRLGLKMVDDIAALPPPVDVPRRTAHGLWMIPHSMFYRALGTRVALVPIRQQVQKARRGLRLAARKKGVFHLWTHPQNLGVGTDKALDGLRQILETAADYRDRGQLDICSMAQLADRLDGKEQV